LGDISIVDMWHLYYFNYEMSRNYYTLFRKWYYEIL